ncbi:MAG TPA: potassium transporter TrkG [Steroidobacteraceae bacterium]|nr:potassium transporter TrkG [Steroidobacteraceae bacterium]
MLAVANALGRILMAFSAAYLLPILAALLARDGTAEPFIAAGLSTAALGAALVRATARRAPELKPRDSFLLVTLGWIVMSAVATIPLLTLLPGLSFTRAFFETMSGLTTTGATVLKGLDHLPPSINLWRATLEWFGGLGIIVLAIAVLPLTGVGGMQLYRGEAPGPIKDQRLTPRITGTVRSLSLAYLTLTLLGIGALRLFGMSWLDAVCHGFSAVGLGAFSTHDASVRYFDSPAIELTLAALMIIASLSFARHFVALRRLTLEPYTRDPEAKAILAVLAASVLGIAWLLTAHGIYPSFGASLRHSLFNVVSIATTSGLASDDYTRWPLLAPFWMLFLCSTLCSTGSAGGGIKMFRTLLLTRQAGRELKLLVHPSAVAPIRIGGRLIPERVMHSVLAFIFLYFTTAVILVLALLATGLDFDTSFGAVVALINNTGPGLGHVGPFKTYHSLTPLQDWICTLTMLLGRVEIFSVLVLLTPAFWRK